MAAYHRSGLVYKPKIPDLKRFTVFVFQGNVQPLLRFSTRNWHNSSHNDLISYNGVPQLEAMVRQVALNV